MGNRLSLLEFEDASDVEADAGLVFYRSVKLKFARSFFSQIAENMLSDFDIYNNRDAISWRSYLKIFGAIKEKRDTENEIYMRSTWHSATTGYIMERIEGEIEYEADSTNEIKGPADDYTDDDESDVSDDDDDDDDDDSDSQEEDGSEAASKKAKKKASVRSKPKERRRKDWNPEMTSPIFFGYSMRSAAEHDEDEKNVQIALKEAEERAVVRTKASRGTLLGSFESASKNQAANRVKKIEKLESQYDTARVKREAMLKKMQKDLPAASFKMFQVSSVVMIICL
jgi:hypothetical protein